MFEFYLVPVQLREDERIPLIQELRLHGVTFSATIPQMQIFCFATARRLTC
jgi:hypothetical protein